MENIKSNQQTGGGNPFKKHGIAEESQLITSLQELIPNGMTAFTQGKWQPRSLWRPRLRPRMCMIGRLLSRKMKRLRLRSQTKTLVCRSLAVVSAGAWALQCWVREAAIVYDVTR